MMGRTAHDQTLGLSNQLQLLRGQARDPYGLSEEGDEFCGGYRTEVRVDPEQNLTTTIRGYSQDVTAGVSEPKHLRSRCRLRETPPKLLEQNKTHTTIIYPAGFFILCD